MTKLGERIVGLDGLRQDGVVRWALPRLAAISVLVGLYFAFIFAETEATMGDVQRIFYFHVASAWVTFLAFFVVFVTSIAYLRTRNWQWDSIACSAAEIGTVFTTVALISGSIWAKKAWGAYWTWDPRLTTTLILWLIYISYLVLRRMVETPQQRAAFSSVLGIIGFVDVPIVFLSIRLWRTIHPVLISQEGMDMTSRMGAAMGVAVIAFTLVFATLVVIRVSLERRRVELDAVKAHLGLY